MRTLFTMDAGDYDKDARTVVRPSVRGILITEEQIAMVHSRKYHYYKFPGGGMEPGEDQIQTLRREVEEESGIRILPESVRPYGVVPRREKCEDGILVQDNFYYLCQGEPKIGSQHLDPYEEEEGFTLEYVTPEYAIRVNRYSDHGPKNQNMLEREARVLECLLDEGYFID